MDDEAILGYHGTNKEDAEKIVTKQNFIPGEDSDNEDFLGKGVYFFKVKDHAVLWNLKKEKDKGKVNLKYREYILKYKVLSANIIINKSNLLDLEKVKDIVKYDKICKRFQEEFQDDLEYAEAEHKDRAIINYFYKKRYMDNIYAIRKIEGQRNRVSSLNVADYLERDIICVKDTRIIRDIKMESDIQRDEYNNIKYISYC